MYKNKIVIIIIFATIFFGCNKWKDHTAVTQQDLTTDLMTALSANADLSKFTSYIKTVGVDTMLQASKTFTVWAPTNTALQTIDPAIVSDLVKLKAFVLNHISNQLYFTKDVAAGIRVPMLSGKYIFFTSTKFDDATITTADRYLKNGALHTINGMSVPLQNIWDFITSTTGQYAQNNYVSVLNYFSFDPTKAIIDSISATTGLPIYHPGSGLVLKNYFIDKVYDLKREDKQYTYFLMQDANFTVEADSLKPYFSYTTAAATDSLTRLYVVKDLAYDVAYQNALSIPVTLISKSGITVPFNNAFVVDVKKMSNGYVYIMSKMDVPTTNKFLPITLEGENPTGFSQNDKSAYISYRQKLNPINSTPYGDLMVVGHGVSPFYSFYRTNDLPSIKYQVYVKAVNDFQSGTFNDSLHLWNNFTNSYQNKAIFAVPLSTATGAYLNEINLGVFTNTKYGNAEWRVTSVTTGPILIDYVRLVPIP